MGLYTWRRRMVDAVGVARNASALIGPVTELPTEKHAWAASENQRLVLLEKEHRTTLRYLIERYKSESLEVRHSTEASYLSRLRRYIIPLWGDLAISDIKPLDVERKN